MQIPRHLHRHIRNTIQENKLPFSGSHSSPLLHSTSFASDFFHVLVPQGMLEKKEEAKAEAEADEEDLEKISS